MSAVIALRNLPRIASVVLTQPLDGGKSWKRLRALLDAAVSRHDPGARVVEDFYVWSDELAGLRGRFEHPHPPSWLLLGSAGNSGRSALPSPAMLQVALVLAAAVADVFRPRWSLLAEIALLRHRAPP
jgi:hypothetical protein